MAIFSTEELEAFRTVKPTAPQQQTPSASKKRGGIGGFVEGIARGVAQPFSYLANSAIINPARELTAKYTGNEIALRNAQRRSNENLGVGEVTNQQIAGGEGDLGGGLKKWAGNSAQALLGAAVPGASSIKGGAALGAGTGASAALAERDSGIGDILTGGLIGGVTGGGISGGAKVLSKLTGRGASAGGAVNDAVKQADMKAMGLNIGDTYRGKVVDADMADDLYKFAREDAQKYGGIRSGKPITQARDANKVFNNVNKELAERRAAINRKLTNDEVAQVVNDAEFKINETLGAEPGKYFTDFKRLAQNKDIDGLEKLRMKADDDAFTLSGAQGNTAKAGEAYAIRDAIDDFVTNLQDEGADLYKATKGDYARAKATKDLLSKGSKSAGGSLKSSQNLVGASLVFTDTKKD